LLSHHCVIVMSAADPPSTIPNDESGSSGGRLRAHCSRSFQRFRGSTGAKADFAACLRWASFRLIAAANAAHSITSVSYVRKGSFGCRTRGRSFELVTGSILVGYPGDEYVCTHDHVCGDECLSIFLLSHRLTAAWMVRQCRTRPSCETTNSFNGVSMS
jgi:hypothetical protein